MNGSWRARGAPFPSVIEKSLEGMEFPASKNEIILYAEDNDTAPEVLDMLSDLEDRVYFSVQDAMLGMAQVL